MTRITSSFTGIQPGKPFTLNWEPTSSNVTISVTPYDNDGNMPLSGSLPIGPPNMNGSTGSVVWNVPSDLPVELGYDVMITESGSKGYSTTSFFFNTAVVTTTSQTPATDSSDAALQQVASQTTLKSSTIPLATTSQTSSVPQTSSYPISTAPSNTTAGMSTFINRTASSASTTISATRNGTLRPGTKAGIGIGVSVGAIAIIALAFFLYRSRKAIGMKLDGILGTKRTPEFGKISTSPPPHTETYYGAGESVETSNKGRKKGIFTH